MSVAELLRNVTIEDSDGFSFDRPRLAVAQDDEIILVCREVASKVPANRRPDVNSDEVMVKLATMAALHFAVNGTSSDSEFDTVHFRLWGHTYSLQDFADQIGKLPHPVARDLAGQPLPMTARVFCRPFARTVFSLLKRKKSDPSWWPQLATKFHRECTGYEYACVDFFPLDPDWMTLEEHNAADRVRRLALHQE